MAADALVYLTYILIILLLGMVCVVIAKKIKMSYIPLFILVGIVLSRISIINFPLVILTSISILVLVVVVFDSASRFRVSKLDKLSSRALNLFVISLVANTVLLTIFTKWIFKIDSTLLALLFAFLISGTDPLIVMAMLGKVKHSIFRLLEMESLFNTPLAVLFPFIILDLMVNTRPELAVPIFLKDFFLGLITSIGIGLLMSILVFKVIKKEHLKMLRPLTLITAVLLAYILAENLGGNSVLVVVTMGLFFGNVHLQNRIQLMELSAMLTHFLEIVVFVLVGFSIGIISSFSLIFILKSLLLFFIYLAVRYASIHISLIRYGDFTWKEKIFMALNAQKGIAVAVVAFSLVTFKIVGSTGLATPFIAVAGVREILDLILLFMLYSIILSTIVIRLSRHFVGVEAKEKRK